jgi:HAD superfamily hydrolase (TIGR01549 family)
MFTDILWDFDGTLFNTYPGITDTLVRALSDEGIQEKYSEVMAHLRDSVAGAIDYYTKAYRLGDTLAERFHRYNQAVDRTQVRMYPYAADVIKAIHRSGKRNYLYTHRGDSAIEYLEERDLIDYFQDCITREDGFPDKPNPEAILYLLDKHKITKSQALMVGDREIDILAAENAEIKSCFFHPDTPEERKSADYNIRSLEQIAPIIA